jgi:hypothetical protein
MAAAPLLVEALFVSRRSLIDVLVAIAQQTENELCQFARGCLNGRTQVLEGLFVNVG